MKIFVKFYTQVGGEIGHSEGKKLGSKGPPRYTQPRPLTRRTITRLECICSMVFMTRMPFLSANSDTLRQSKAPPFSTNLGCVLHRWHHELVALFCWTTGRNEQTLAKAPGSLSVDSRCRSYCHPGCDRLVSGISSHFLVLCRV